MLETILSVDFDSTFVSKEKSIEKIDGIVALIMGLDRCIRHQGDGGSVYDERGILSF
ncbi:hypothetical protein GCM10011510_05180 [Streptococcus himalayensis]|uniref:Uncharacterized protein n=1 Tax=Streptococcus himalayensis TaxID=1888195 RepID=A0A917A6S7_9STRE|nr:terminase [Streptococcus himalayensis]QBX16537.1 terminase large subunit [Streptococcus phage Javan255]GGE26929.1 hypothetical protein GCM10011510_05180 [Streptococcus himalayensis]